MPPIIASNNHNNASDMTVGGIINASDTLLEALLMPLTVMSEALNVSLCIFVQCESLVFNLQMLKIRHCVPT